MREHLQASALELGIENAEFSRTHWSIKNNDLFRWLCRNRQPYRAQPKVFKLNDPEDLDERLVSVMMPFDLKFDPLSMRNLKKQPKRWVLAAKE